MELQLNEKFTDGSDGFFFPIGEAQVNLDILTQVGVGGILAVLILDRVFSFLSKKKGVPEEVAFARRQINDLWKHHNNGKHDTSTILEKLDRIEKCLEKIEIKVGN